MKTSACIEMLFTEVPFIDRIGKAAEAGFDAIEFWNWDNKDLEAVKLAVAAAGIRVASFQSNRGGTLIEPSHRHMFVSGIEESLEKACDLGSDALFLLTDELGDDRSVKFKSTLSFEEKRNSVFDGLKAIAPLAERAGITIVLEPLNTLVDHPGYFLDSVDLGAQLVREVASPRVRLLFDIYHVQVMQGNLIERLIKHLDVIGHVHVADVPGRHEPGTGEINYRNVFGCLRDAGYDKTIGFEYIPTLVTEVTVASSLATL
jgi:hydroxypyruvate isomerase